MASQSHSEEVAVLMPVSSGERVLPQTLDSLANQTFQNWHLYALVNGSTDDSMALLRGFQEVWGPRVTLLEIPFVIKPGVARNILAEKCKANYVVFWDQDDLHPAGSIQALYSSIPADAVAVHGDLRFIDESSQDFRHHLALQENAARSRVNWKRPRATSRSLRNAALSSRIRLGASMVRAATFQEVGGFWNFNGGEDYSFWVRVSLVGKILHTPQIVLLRRIHRDNLSSDPARRAGNLLVMGELQRLQSLRGRAIQRNFFLFLQTRISKDFHSSNDKMRLRHRRNLRT